MNQGEKPTYHCWVRILSITDKAGPRPPQVAVTRPKNSSVPPGVWYVAEEFRGVPGANVALEYGPAYADGSAAIEWITSQEGLRWAKEAANYFLMCFDLGAEKLGPEAAR